MTCPRPHPTSCPVLPLGPRVRQQPRLFQRLMLHRYLQLVLLDKFWGPCQPAPVVEKAPP